LNIELKSEINFTRFTSVTKMLSSLQGLSGIAKWLLLVNSHFFRKHYISKIKKERFPNPTLPFT
jgi:hypothetical protein